ncbi:MAG: hypothetical protein ABR913_00405 [Sedimentisphaerales bacterium]
MALNDAISHKCATAYKLISSLRDIVSSSRAGNSYPQWSDYFLSFCERTADESLKYIENRLEISKSGDEIECKIVNEQLSSLIQSWEMLHAFINPVIAADTLKVPHPLISFISEHIGSLNVVKDAKIVIELTPEMNYHQHPLTKLRKVLTNPPLNKYYKKEPRLGFLGLPCSQSKSLFMNCQLYHEVGHFIAEETGVFSTEWLDSIDSQLKGDISNSGWAANTVQTWMGELFADIIAVRLIGPAYTFAYIEQPKLLENLPEKQILTFGIDHPADSLRLREQLDILKEDEWDKSQISSLKQWEELNRIAAIKQSDYLPPIDYQDDAVMKPVWEKMMSFLCQKDKLKEIHNLAKKKTEDRIRPTDLFNAYGESISEYLSHGVVPSACRKNGEMPHPIAIINSAVYFLLSGMKGLFDIVQVTEKDKISSLVWLEHRVEMWCMKAIEDWLVRPR